MNWEKPRIRIPESKNQDDLESYFHNLEKN